MEWVNWSGSQRCTPARFVTPRTRGELAQAIVEGPAPVRVAGAGHSFSGGVATEGTLISLDLLARVLDADAATGLVRVEAGIRLHQLSQELHARRLAMPNLGDIDAQSLAGALSTGTHGTGAEFGGLATQVRGLQLVTPSGEVIDCDADRRPDVFSAARIGLGALGVVTSVTLQALPAFALRAVEGPGTLTAAIEGFDELMTGTDHVEFYWFPHTDVTLVKCNTRVPLEEGLVPLPRWRAVWDDEILANGAFAGVVAAGRRVPALIPPLARMSVKALGARTWTDHSHRVFVSRRRVRFLEMEYAVPRADAPGVLAELRRVHEASDWRAAFPVEVRVAAADDVPLSTASGRDSAYIAAHVPAGTDPGPWFAALEAIAGEVGGRPHWGKLHGLDADVLRTRYPRFDEFVALRDRLDPVGVLSNAYLERVLGPAAGPA
jgi:FAD-linked oxidoreductase